MHVIVRCFAVFLTIISYFSLLPSAKAQNWDWATQTLSISRSGGATCLAASPTTDASGNTYAGGIYYDSVRFGTTLLTSTSISTWGVTNGFVSKVSPTGQWLWSAAMKSPNFVELDGIGLMPNGDVVVTGIFADTVQLINSAGNPSGSPIILTVPSGQVSTFITSCFVARISANGQWQWATNVVGDNTYPRAIVADAVGNVVFSGVLGDTAVFGNTTLISNGQADGFVARLSPTGQWQWTAQCGSSGRDGVIGLTTDPNGTIYATGRFGQGSATFGSIHPTATGELDGFVGALSSLGVWQWVEPIPTTDLCAGFALAREPITGDLLVGGTYTGQATIGNAVLPADSLDNQTAFVARYAPAARQWLWATSGGTPGFNDYVLGVGFDDMGTAYASGEFGIDANSNPMHPIAIATFGPLSVTGFGGSDGFIARLSGQGQWERVIPWGGERNDFAGGFTVAPNGRLIVSATITSLNAHFGATTLHTNAQLQYLSEAIIAQLTIAPVGLREATDTRYFTLTPNPAHAMAQLQLAQAIGTAQPLKILDGLGRIVHTQTVPAGQTTVNLSLLELPAGVYTVRVGHGAARLAVE